MADFMPENTKFVLYDKSEKNYAPDNQQAWQAWQDIRHKMNKYCNIDGSLLENGRLAEKFEKCKSLYRDEKKKTIDDAQYNPTLHYYSLMDAFLAEDLKAKLAGPSNSKRKMEMSNSEWRIPKKVRETIYKTPNKVGRLGESSKSSWANQRHEDTRPKTASSQSKRNPAFYFFADVKGKAAEQLEKMIQQSNQLADGACKVERIGSPNLQNISKVYIRIDPDFYSKIDTDSFYLNIGSDTYKLQEHNLLVQCYNCWMFVGHKRPACNSTTRCCRCGDTGCLEDCGKPVSCLNCADYNLGSHGETFDTSHPANDPKCPRRVQLEKIERAKYN